MEESDAPLHMCNQLTTHVTTLGRVQRITIVRAGQRIYREPTRRTHSAGGPSQCPALCISLLAPQKKKSQGGQTENHYLSRLPPAAAAAGLAKYERR